MDRRLVDPRAGLEKIFEPIGTRTPTPSVVQPVASRYTDYAISVRITIIVSTKTGKSQEHNKNVYFTVTAVE
jgi:hypothetical protein